MMAAMRTLVLLAAVMLLSATVAHAQDTSVYVNDQPITLGQVEALESVYGPIAPGAYWYDPVSGWWGAEGGPVLGQIDPALPLGGPLRADASGGGTGVFINGRELHPVDVARLEQRFGRIPRGRYWVGADGIGGPEGGPATFNLAARPSGGGPTTGGGYSGTTDRGYGGTYASDGRCYYISVEGGEVMGPGC
jgi:hypothetical protein